MSSTVSKQQLFNLLDVEHEINGLSNNADEIRQVMYNQYGIDADIDRINQWLSPTINEDTEDLKILLTGIGYR